MLESEVRKEGGGMGKWLEIWGAWDEPEPQPRSAVSVLETPATPTTSRVPCFMQPPSFPLQLVSSPSWTELVISPAPRRRVHL